VTAGDEAVSADGNGMTYEQLVEALEDLTGRMADGAIGIEEAVALYERAGRLHALAAERLARVQARIDALAAEQAEPGEDPGRA
jgi:exodeoxyribonuclease VII small subunit